jgi:hypothetical protein
MRYAAKRNQRLGRDRPMRFSTLRQQSNALGTRRCGHCRNIFVAKLCCAAIGFQQARKAGQKCRFACTIGAKDDAQPARFKRGADALKRRGAAMGEADILDIQVHAGPLR